MLNTQGMIFLGDDLTHSVWLLDTSTFFCRYNTSQLQLDTKLIFDLLWYAAPRIPKNTNRKSNLKFWQTDKHTYLTIYYTEPLRFSQIFLYFFQGSTSSTSSVGSNSSTGSMEVSTRNGLNGKTVTPVNTSNSAAPGTPNKHVNFGGGTGEEKKREKFLTAKYGAHQMALIRKRLRVEMWMYERLTEIYGAVSFLIFISWNWVKLKVTMDEIAKICPVIMIAFFQEKIVDDTG